MNLQVNINYEMFLVYFTTSDFHGTDMSELCAWFRSNLNQIQYRIHCQYHSYNWVKGSAEPTQVLLIGVCYNSLLLIFWYAIVYVLTKLHLTLKKGYMLGFLGKLHLCSILHFRCFHKEGIFLDAGILKKVNIKFNEQMIT